MALFAPLQATLPGVIFEIKDLTIWETRLKKLRMLEYGFQNLLINDRLSNLRFVERMDSCVRF